MTRRDGFDRLDLATDIHHDPKFRALAHRHPDLWPAAFAVYVVLLAESWREGERLTLDEAWPDAVPFDPAIIAALTEARLIDEGQRVPTDPDPDRPRGWAAWFDAAADRRRRGREYQHRADVKRGRVKDPPATPVSVSQTGSPSASPSGPTSAPRTDQVGSNVGETREPTDEDEPNAAGAYWRLVGHRPGGTFLQDLVKVHGDEAVSRALAHEYERNPDHSTLLSRTRKRLDGRPDPSPRPVRPGVPVDDGWIPDAEATRRARLEREAEREAERAAGKEGKAA